VLNEHATVGPSHMPLTPMTNLNDISNVIGIPNKKYAIKVIIAPVD
jgi:hypothetical protein